MADQAPTDIRSKARAQAASAPTNGNGLLSVKLSATPAPGDTISFTEEDGRTVLWHNQSRHPIPSFTDDLQQDVIILRWEESVCGGAPTFRNSDPVAMSTEIQHIFGERGWETLPKVA